MILIFLLLLLLFERSLAFQGDVVTQLKFSFHASVGWGAPESIRRGYIREVGSAALSHFNFLCLYNYFFLSSRRRTTSIF